MLQGVSVKNPVVYCEVGARKGANRFRRIGRHVEYYGFEPDKPQAEALQSKLRAAQVFRGASIMPCAVMGKKGPVQINVLRHRGCSSALEPNKELVSQFSVRRGNANRWADYFDVVSTYRCDAVSLDDFSLQNKFSWIHFLGLDTQGTELDILNGGKQIVSTSTFIVHVEMETVHLYRKQPLINDVMDALYKWGFRLISIENRQHISRWPAAAEDMTDLGEMVSVDGFFCRELTDEFFERAIAEGVIAPFMLTLYDLGFRTLAIDVGRRVERVRGESAEEVKSLTAALLQHYHLDESRHKSITRRMYELVRDIVPTRIRKSLRRALPF